LKTGQTDQGFRRSTFCGSSACVEVAPRQDGSVAVRSTSDREQRELVYTREEWVAFIRGAKAGEFDFGPGIGAGLDSATVRISR